MRNCMVVLLSIHLIKQVQILDAFILSCNASLQTVSRVTMCPSDMSAYEEAVKKKNCSSMAADAHACQSFEYHCVLSDDLKYAIEVCAPKMYIVGYACAKFSTSFRSIIRIDDFACNDSTIMCPYRYNSTLAFLQTLCYANITYPLTTEIPLRTESVIKNETNREIKETDNEGLKNSKFLLILLVVPCICIGLIIILYWRRRIEVRRKTARQPEDIELQNRDPLLNHGGSAEDPNAENQNGTNIDITLSNDETSDRIQQEQNTTYNEGNSQNEERAVFSNLSDQQQMSTNEDSCYQASIKTTLNASSERDQLMLECPVNLLIRHLRDPDETWTKELIISHVEDMIQRLVNSNEEQLFISFMRSLNNDERIATTLLRCGEKMFELVSSIQEKYAARNIAFTDGCVCVTFSFANVDDLENYLEKVRNKDEQLTIDLSRILLNKTLLSIFDINPTLATWNASELKVFKGSQLLKTEAFQETLTGSSKDFIGISEDDATETYIKTRNILIERGTRRFISKYDMFNLRETSKYPGYMNYKTRAKSFEGAVLWMEVKRREFAIYGFLYQGIDLKTTCFHCGCSKDDWTEQDDILSTHVSLNKSCAYVQFLMEQE